MLNTKGSTKILNFMTHGAGVLALGRGQICHAVKMEYFFKFFLFTQGMVYQNWKDYEPVGRCSCERA